MVNVGAVFKVAYGSNSGPDHDEDVIGPVFGEIIECFRRADADGHSELK